jgi:hypothetical protein
MREIEGWGGGNLGDGIGEVIITGDGGTII